jgi:hypothetical protein
MMVEFVKENIWLIVNFAPNFIIVIYCDDVNYKIAYVICFFCVKKNICQFNVLMMCELYG